MRLTALDIYQQDFRKRFRGFDTNEVESFLEVLARDFEELTQDNSSLRNRSTTLEEQIQEYRHKETGKRVKYSVKGRLITEKGMFFADDHAWRLTKAVKGVLEKMEREVVKSIGKKRRHAL